MTSSHPPALGLSVGTTTLAAVTVQRAVTGHPTIKRAGCPIEDFVHRVGDPVGIVAADGSVHTGAALLAEALYDLARTSMSGHPVTTAATVAYPAHWRPAAVEALNRALRRIPAWASGAALVPDYAAALTALQASPGLPARGVIAVCDFGASVTTLTLVDAVTMTAIGQPVRYPDFCGDLIDRVLLTHVLTGVGVAPGATGTTAIGALTRLRNDCREAKERLSTQTVTTVAGPRGEIRITRPELDDLVREPLAGFVAALADTLQRNGVAPADLVAVASVGGMAAVPAVTTTLSEQLRVPIISDAEPALSAARGAMLRRAGETLGEAAATVITAHAVEPGLTPEFEADEPARAWSHAAEVPDVVPQLSTRSAGRLQPRPQMDFVAQSDPPRDDRTPWHRKPLALVAAVLAVVAGAGAATAVALRADTSAAPASPAPGISATQAPAPVNPAGHEPPLRTVVAVPAPADSTMPVPPSNQIVVAAPAPVSGPVAGPAVSAPAAAPVEVDEAPAPAQVAEVQGPAPQPAPPALEPTPVTEVATVAPAPAAAPPIPALPAIPAIPAIPQIPIPLITDLTKLIPQPPASG